MNKQDSNNMSASNWSAFQKDKKRNVPSNAAKMALKLFGNRKGLAIDIGCGAGADSVLMLESDWRVIALDHNILGINIVYESLDEKRKDNLYIVQETFENMKLPICDWLNASYALPFVRPEDYHKVWQKINNSIISDGIFSGTFFGNKDSWAPGNTLRTFHTKEQVINLFEGFAIEWFDEREREGTSIDASGIEHPKHWHIFEVVARKLV